MREFEVLVCVHVKANSFAGAEQIVTKAMADAFEASKGTNPIEFQQLSMFKGRKVEF